LLFFFIFLENGEFSPISRVLGKDFRVKSLMKRVWLYEKPLAPGVY